MHPIRIPARARRALAESQGQVWCWRAAGKGILDARSHERRVGHEQMLVIEQRHDGHTHTQRHFVHLRQLLAALVHSLELFDGLVQRGFVRGVLG